MTSNRMPQSDSIKELARFWDTHDLTNFEGALEEVQEPVFYRETAITLRLQVNDAEVIRKLAASKGVSVADLIHEWVREKIHAT